MKKQKKQNKSNFFIFEFLFLILLFIVIGLLIKTRYQITPTLKKYVVIEKSRKDQMDLCQYTIKDSIGKELLYYTDYKQYKVGDTIRF